MGEVDITNYNFNQIEKEWLELLSSKTESEIIQAVEAGQNKELFDTFSPLRTAVLKWYDFAEDARVLEIGSGYGTITGMLCDKCSYVAAYEKHPKKAYILMQRHKKRDNLRVVSQDMSELKKEKFDYIVFNATFGYQCSGSKNMNSYVEYVDSLKDMLTDRGRILIVTENRLGVSYLCGKPAPGSNMPFDTLLGYSKNSSYYTFTKSELVYMAENSCYPNYRFYYPIPDHLYTQEVYSDDYAPSKKVEERILQQYTYNHSAVADERKLLREFMENNVFDIITNSYILELSVDSSSEVAYATTTLDRGELNASVTVIYKNNIVKKAPAFGAGISTINNIYNNHNMLRSNGIPVIEQALENNTLVMPRIKKETLSAYLGSHIFSRAEELYDIFDRLYNYIILSSDESETCDMNMDEGVNLGVVLKKAYIDMVPFNCFISEDGNFTFFDQEFVFDNYPAGYVMYRALMYTYLFEPHLGNLVPLDEMKKRYGLDDLWCAYEKEEQNFVAGNRRYDVNRYFWDRTYLDSKTIERTKKLMFTTAGEGYIRMKQTEEKALLSADEKEYEYELGYIAGVFDLFHVGHLNLLEKAKAKCRKLLVGALTDELVVHFKGKKPYIPLEERMRILESNKNVDGVVAVDFSNIDKMDAWKLYRFDCLFSGDDWKDAPHWQKDKERLQAVGSNIHFFEYTKSTSSTQIKEMINKDKK